MDKTKKEIVFSILEGLSSYNITDDTVFDIDYLKYQVDVARIALIKEEYKAHVLGDQYYQPICCLEIKCQQEGCNVPQMGWVKSGEVTYYADMPGTISFMGYDNIKYLGPVGWGGPAYTRVAFNTFVNGVNGIWTMGDPTYTIIHGKALFKNLPSDGLRYFCMLGLLESPESSCEWDEDSPYPISDPLKIEIIVVKNILSRLGINYSDKNDASPDINQQQQKK